MLPSITAISLMALILILINRKNGRYVEGLKEGIKQFLSFLPLIVASLLLAGIIEAIIPEAFVKQWLAQEAGFKGIIAGTIGGMFLAMGPYQAFPIISSVYNAGAGLGTMVSIITSWALLGLHQIPCEASIFGFRFVFIKVVLGVPFCFLTGIVAYLLETIFIG